MGELNALDREPICGTAVAVAVAVAVEDPPLSLGECIDIDFSGECIGIDIIIGVSKDTEASWCWS
jgi:hypothetical protein